VLSEFDLPIRQIFVTDPHMSEDPKLVIIVDEELPVGVVEKIRALPQVKQVII
jgi:predicted regulator of amino acid metabolism with ACT domain